jgi:hypothetical protein
MTFIKADIPQFCGDHERPSATGYINIQHVEHVVSMDRCRQLACYAADGRLIGYVMASTFAKAIKGKVEV